MSFSLFGLFKDGASNLGNLRDKLLIARAALVEQQERFPDLAGALQKQIEELDAQIATLDAPLSDEAVANLAVIVLPEVTNVINALLGRGEFKPKPHAGDSV